MPLYDYKCIGCGKITEKLSTWNNTIIDCPKCGSKANVQISAHAKTASAWEVNKRASVAE